MLLVMLTNIINANICLFICYPASITQAIMMKLYIRDNPKECNPNRGSKQESSTFKRTIIVYMYLGNGSKDFLAILYVGCFEDD